MNLQPLKVAAGWCVEWNLLTDIDPSVDTIHEFTGSSLLFLNSPKHLKAIDVCWKPEADINGYYQLTVIPTIPVFNKYSNTIEYEGLWDEVEVLFKTKDRLELVDKLNELMFYLKPYTDKRILIKPGVIDEIAENIRLNMMNNSLTTSVKENILESKHKKLEELLLDHPDVLKDDILYLANNGTNKRIRNKAKQLLNSKRFK